MALVLPSPEPLPQPDLHHLFYPRCVTTRFPPVPCFDPMLVLKGAPAADTTTRAYLVASTQDTETKIQTAGTAATSSMSLESLSSTTEMVPLAVDTFASDAPVYDDDPVVCAKGKYEHVPILPWCRHPDGKVEIQRLSNSHRDLQPITVVLRADPRTLPNYKSILGALVYLQTDNKEEARLASPELHPRGNYTTATQAQVIQSIVDYEPVLFDVSRYQEVILHGNESEHPGSPFASTGPFNCLADIAEYARISGDWTRVFQLCLDISMHAWCLANDRFCVYRPTSASYSELNPPCIQVFFRDDFPLPHDVWTSLPSDLEKTITDKTENILALAKELDCASFVFVVLTYVAKHHGEGKFKFDSKFRNLCSRDFENGMRTLRKRQVHVGGVVAHIQKTVATSVERVQYNKSGMDLCVSWGTRSTTTAPGIDQLALHFVQRRTTTATTTAKPSSGSNSSNNNKSTSEATVKRTSHRSKKLVATRGAKVDDVTDAVYHAVPFVYHSLGLDFKKAVLDTSGVREPGNRRSPLWILDMLQLFGTIGSRSEREVKKIERRVRRTIKDEQKQQRQHQQLQRRQLQPLKAERIEPFVSESRLVYTFRMMGAGELSHRSPLSQDLRDIVAQHRDVTSPCYYTDSAFRWLMEHGVDVLFGDRVDRDRLRPGVSLASTREPIRSDFSVVVFEETQSSPGIMGTDDGRFVPHGEHCFLIRQAHDRPRPFTVAFKEFVSRHSFVARFRDLHNSKSAPSTCLRLFKVWVALRCLIKDEADVLRTLASRFRAKFVSTGESKEFQSELFLRYLQFGDYLYRAHVAYNIRVVDKLVPQLYRVVQATYVDHFAKANTVYAQKEDHGLFEADIVMAWLQRVVQPRLIYNAQSPEVTAFFEAMMQRNPTAVPQNMPQFILADLQQTLVSAIRTQLGNTQLGPTALSQWFASQESKARACPVFCAFQLPPVDGHQIASHKTRVNFSLPLDAAVDAITAHFLDLVAFPALQFAAMATLPAPVLYEHKDILTRKVSSVPWFALARMCQQTPLEREMDRITREFSGAATALAVKFKQPPTAPGLLSLFKTEGNLPPSRLNKKRLTAAMSLINSFVAVETQPTDKKFQVDYDDFVSKAATTGGVQTQHTAVITKCMRQCAQDLLLRLRRSTPDVSLEVLQDMHQKLLYDADRPPELPQHGLDLLKDAFRHDFQTLPDVVAQTVLRNIIKITEENNRGNGNGSGSRSPLGLDTQMEAALKRLAEFVKVQPTKALVLKAPQPKKRSSVPQQQQQAKKTNKKVNSKKQSTALQPVLASALLDPVRIPIAVATVVPDVVAAIVVAAQSLTEPVTPPLLLPPPLTPDPALTSLLSPIQPEPSGKDEKQEVPIVPTTETRLSLRPTTTEEEEEVDYGEEAPDHVESQPPVPSMASVPSEPLVDPPPKSTEQYFREMPPRSPVSSQPPPPQVNGKKRSRSKSPSREPKRSRPGTPPPRPRGTQQQRVYGNGYRDHDRDRERSSLRRTDSSYSRRELTHQELRERLDRRVNESRNYDPEKRDRIVFYPRNIRS